MWHVNMSIEKIIKQDVYEIICLSVSAEEIYHGVVERVKHDTLRQVGHAIRINGDDFESMRIENDGD